MNAKDHESHGLIWTVTLRRKANLEGNEREGEREKRRKRGRKRGGGSVRGERNLYMRKHTQKRKMFLTKNMKTRHPNSSQPSSGFCSKTEITDLLILKTAFIYDENRINK